jgi:plastocyanin
VRTSGFVRLVLVAVAVAATAPRAGAQRPPAAPADRQDVVRRQGGVVHTLGGSQDDRRREVAVTVSEAGFEPARIDARLDDIVSITLTAQGSPHAWSLDAYRIAKRAEPGTPLKFEFRAETTGTFRYYCSLTGADGHPHDEHGELVVRR